MKIRLKFLKRFINWIGEQFEKQKPFIQKAIEAGVKVTEAIKNVVNDPSLDFITELTKTDLDNQAVQKIRGFLPEIFKSLGLINDISLSSIPEAISSLITKTDNEKAIFYHALSIEIIRLASDGEISTADMVYLSQWYYDHRIKSEQPSK